MVLRWDRKIELVKSIQAFFQPEKGRTCLHNVLMPVNASKQTMSLCHEGCYFGMREPNAWVDLRSNLEQAFTARHHRTNNCVKLCQWYLLERSWIDS